MIEYRHSICEATKENACAIMEIDLSNSTYKDIAESIVFNCSAKKPPEIGVNISMFSVTIDKNNISHEVEYTKNPISKSLPVPPQLTRGTIMALVEAFLRTPITDMPEKELADNVKMFLSNISEIQEFIKAHD